MLAADSTRRWGWSPCTVEVAALPVPRLHWTLTCPPLVQPLGFFPFTHLPVLLNQAWCLDIYGKGDSVSQVRALTCKLGSGQAARLGRGVSEMGWWGSRSKKADFVWEINFNFVETHNPLLLDSVGRALDA